MLDFYFKVAFKDGSEQYLQIIAATALSAWDILIDELNILGWTDSINNSETKMIFPTLHQQSNGKYFENFGKSY